MRDLSVPVGARRQSMTSLPSESMPPVERHSVRRNLAHMMTSQVITWTVTTVASLIVPRFVGPDALGDLRLANSLWLIALTVTALGTQQFLQLEIARNAQRGLQLVGPTLVLRSIAFAMCSVMIAVYVGLTADSGHFYFLVAMIGASTILFQWSDVLATAFVGLERMSTTALAGAAGKAVSSALVIAVVVAGLGIEGIVVVGVVAAVGALAWMAWKYRQIARVTLRGWTVPAASILRGSATYMAVAVALVTYQQVDMIVISWVAESEDLGWYGASDTLFGSLLFPSTVLIGTLFPALGRLHSSDRSQLESMVTRAFSMLAVVSVPIGLGTVLVAPTFAPLLYGEDFREAGTVLAVLGPVIIVTYGTILLSGIALATERARLWVGVLCGAAALTVPLDLALVPWAEDRWDNGAIGGALAYVVTETLQFVIGIAFVAPYLARRSTAWRSARILAAGLVMFAAGWPLREQFFLIPVAVCGSVYVAAIVIFRVLGEDERRIVSDIAQRIGIRRG